MQCTAWIREVGVEKGQSYFEVSNLGLLLSSVLNLKDKISINYSWLNGMV